MPTVIHSAPGPERDRWTVDEAKWAYAEDFITTDELEQIIHELEFEQTISPIVLHRDLPAREMVSNDVWIARLLMFCMGLVILIWQALGPQEPAMIVFAAGAMGFWGLSQPS